MSFQKNSEIIGSALSICCKMFEGSMGTECKPAESRIARNPLAVLSDMQDILLQARKSILQYQIEDEL